MGKDIVYREEVEQLVADGMAGFAQNAAMHRFDDPTSWFPPVGVSQIGTVAPSNGRLRYSPFPVDLQVSVDRIAVSITSAGSSGAVVRLGVFTGGSPVDRSSPRVLLRDCGTIAADVTGFREITIPDGPLTLSPRLYWLGAVTQGDPTTVPTYVANLDSLVVPIGHRTGSTVMDGPRAGYNLGGITGGFPSPASPSANGSNAVPRIILRKAA